MLHQLNPHETIMLWLSQILLIKDRIYSSKPIVWNKNNFKTYKWIFHKHLLLINNNIGVPIVFNKKITLLTKSSNLYNTWKSE